MLTEPVHAGARTPWFVAWLGCLAAAWPGQGQEALRNSLAGEEAAQSRRLVRERRSSDADVGAARFSWGARLDTEWNSNITLVEREVMEDVILRPQTTLQLSWPVTTVNYFDARLSAGYAKYLSHSRFDRPFVLPGSEVGFDVFWRDVRITFEDRFSYQQDPVERAVVTGTAEFGGLDNVAGVRALVDWGDLKWLASYHHQLFLSTTPGYRHLDRSSHMLFNRLSIEPRPYLETGVEVGVTPTIYSQSYLRDNLGLSAGGYAQASITPNIFAYARGGGAVYEFSEGAGVQNFYFGAGLTHRLRKAMTVSIQGGQEDQLGVNQDLVQLTYGRIRGDWLPAKRVRVNAQLGYEDGNEFGQRSEERFSRINAGAGIGWRFAEKWATQLNWNMANRDSEAPLRGYDNMRVTLSVSYDP